MDTRNTKQTSRPVAKKASALLRDGRTSAKTKSVAASALAQAKPRKGKQPSRLSCWPDVIRQDSPTAVAVKAVPVTGRPPSSYTRMRFSTVFGRPPLSA